MRYAYVFLLFSLPLYAQQSFVITAEPLENISLPSGDEWVISDQEIAQNQQTFTNETLSFNPSVNISQSGQEGRQTNFFIRGATGKENLVIVDGVPLNDPVSGEFDFSNFLNGDVKSVTVIPGSQSLRYGSDAIGGVVSIDTFKGQGPWMGSAFGEGGGYNTQHSRLRVSGEEGPLQLALTSSGYNSGRGSFRNRVRGTHQSDRYKNGTLTGHIGYALTPFWDMEAGIRHSDAHVKYDQYTSELPTAADNHQYTQTLSTYGQTSGAFWEGTLEQVLRVNYHETQRTDKTPTRYAETHGQRFQMLSETTLDTFKDHTTVAGLLGERESIHAISRHNRTHTGAFVQHQWSILPHVSLSGGVRADHYQKTGSHLTYRVGADYFPRPDTRLRTNIGTGFKAPLLSDLYSSGSWTAPNPNLRPEKSVSFDMGVDHQFWDKKALVNLTFFVTKIRDVFALNYNGSKYITVNNDQRLSKGIEGAFEIKPFDQISFRQTLTYTHARNKVGQMHIRTPRIPTIKTTSQIHLYPTQDSDIFLSALNVNTRRDRAMGPKLPPHTVLTLGASIHITPKVKVFGRIENLGNSAYEDVYGYGARGRTVMIGLDTVIGGKP